MYSVYIGVWLLVPLSPTEHSDHFCSHTIIYKHFCRFSDESAICCPIFGQVRNFFRFEDKTTNLSAVSHHRVSIEFVDCGHYLQGAFMRFAHAKRLQAVIGNFDGVQHADDKGRAFARSIYREFYSEYHA